MVPTEEGRKAIYAGNYRNFIQIIMNLSLLGFILCGPHPTQCALLIRPVGERLAWRYAVATSHSGFRCGSRVLWFICLFKRAVGLRKYAVLELARLRHA